MEANCLWGIKLDRGGNQRKRLTALTAFTSLALLGLDILCYWCYGHNKERRAIVRSSSRIPSLPPPMKQSVIIWPLNFIPHDSPYFWSNLCRLVVEFQSFSELIFQLDIITILIEFRVEFYNSVLTRLLCNMLNCVIICINKSKPRNQLVFLYSNWFEEPLGIDVSFWANLLSCHLRPNVLCIGFWYWWKTPAHRTLLHFRWFDFDLRFDSFSVCSSWFNSSSFHSDDGRKERAWSPIGMRPSFSLMFDRPIWFEDWAICLSANASQLITLPSFSFNLFTSNHTQQWKHLFKEDNLRRRHPENMLYVLYCSLRESQLTMWPPRFKRIITQFLFVVSLSSPHFTARV